MFLPEHATNSRNSPFFYLFELFIILGELLLNQKDVTIATLQGERNASEASRVRGGCFGVWGIRGGKGLGCQGVFLHVSHACWIKPTNRSCCNILWWRECS